MPDPLNITLTPGYLPQEGEFVTNAILRLIARPTILLSGSIGASLIADGSITLVKLVDGILTADAAGRAKMQDGYIVAAKIGANEVTFVKLDANIMQDATAKAAPVAADILWLGDSADSFNTKKATLTQAAPAIAGAIAASTSVSYASANTVITTGLVINAAHGLGGVPRFVRVVFVCTTIDLSYAVGDEVDAACAQTSGEDHPITWAANATHVMVTLTDAAPEFAAKGGGNTQITTASWRLKVYATK